MRVVEIESLSDFDRRVRDGAVRARGWHIQSVDLTGRSQALADLDVAGAVFLGCRFAEGVLDDVRRRGGRVFPAIPDVPFDSYRATLYTPDELYAGLEKSYGATPDARIYSWNQGKRAVDRTLATALHDHAIDDALEEYVEHRSVVGIMGGHAALRGSADYRAAARLGHVIGAHFTVATGGGPGAMEAANLGAFLPEGTDLAQVVDRLAAVPGFTPDVRAWASAGLSIRREFPQGRDSLGVPTWFYGHEPPNVFASHVAKYFHNAIREDDLLRICGSGIVCLPGAAGTVQEVFQAACENYYATPGDVAPIVLVGRLHWTTTLPVWPLLQALAADSPMRVHLVDEVDQVLAVLSG